MVISADNNNNNHSMATTRTTSSKTTSRSRHNFSSAPTFNFTWGGQRHLRCVKHPELYLPSGFGAFASETPNYPPPSDDDDDEEDDGDGDGIDAVREKLTIDFRAELDQLKATYLKPQPPPPPMSGNDVETAATTTTTENRPWNLRTRRVCKIPINSNCNGNNFDRKPNSSPAKNSDGELAREEKKRVKFTVSLSKREIEEDFLAMAGVRPARRPKKRAKSVQKQVDAICPGFWLTEINADMYKVIEQLPDDSKV
ncbi:hypothetical protein KSS87_002433 [Heliosperma pusillum]|nr:hypothetical protein KSS87_002433 [Heliosperma pusillum]